MSVYKLEIVMNKYARILFALVIMILLVSCVSSPDGSGSDEQVQGAEDDAVTKEPFPDLEPILMEENILPPGYSSGVTSHGTPTYYNKLFVPDADYVIRQRFQKDGSSAGQIIVFYYVEQGSTHVAFDSITDDMQVSRMLEGLGEKAEIEIVSESSVTSQISVGIVFVECHVAVHISMLGTDDEQAVNSYAEDLSERLEPLVCD